MEQNQNPIADMLAKQDSNVESTASQGTQSQETEAQEEQPINQETSGSSEEDFNESNEQQDNENSTQELENSEAENSIEDSNSQNEESDDSGSSEGIEEKNWWDEDSKGATEKTVNEEVSKVDYSNLSKALGIESRNEADIVKEFEGIRQQNEEYKQKVEELSKDPQFADEKLAQANEIAKNGGDYQEFLGISQTDWSLVGDDELIAAMQLKSVFGEDTEGMNKYMSDMDPVQKKLQADQLRGQLNQEQSYAMEKIRQDAAKKKIETDSKIRSSIDKADSMYGVKLTSSKKKDLYNQLTTGDFLKNLFYKDGKVDHQNMVENAYLLTNINEIMKVNISRATNKGKAEVFNEASNPSVKNVNGQFVAPTKKETTAFGDYMNSLKTGGPQ